MTRCRDHKRSTVRLAVALAAAVTGWSAAQAAQRLEPLSKTAESITGPVMLDTASIRFGRRAILRLQPAGSAVPFDGGSGTGKVKADLYRILTPADPVLIRGNRLCGSGKPLTFLLVWSQKGISGPVTTLAPSTSPSPPATMGDICGTYSYVPRG